MKVRSAELKTVCGFTSTLPASELPEIAFAGRSNVGKSSLINVLMQRKRLARVGATPGKTRTINFYEIDALMKRGSAGPAGPGQDMLSAGQTQAEPEPAEAPCVFQLVDLPGYGYANVSLEEKARWGKMIERYLNSQRDLRAVFLLLDIRHEPNANDRQMYDWIVRSGHTPVLVATKVDAEGDPGRAECREGDCCDSLFRPEQERERRDLCPYCRHAVTAAGFVKPAV